MINNNLMLGVQLISVLLLMAILIGLQIFLSKRENPLFGWFIPVWAFLASFFVPLSMTVPSTGVTAGFIVQMIAVFLLSNIPTAIFLLIYFTCRQKKGKIKELDKMNIQDLD